MQKSRILLSQFLFIFVAVVISACSNTVTPTPTWPEVPDVGIDASLLNKDLKISFFPDQNTFKIGEDVVLVIKLITPDIKIRTTNNFNARMFILDNSDNKWVDVKDVGIYIDQGYFIIDKDNKNSIVSVRPDLNEKSKDVTLLIMVTGDIMNGDLVTGSIAGSYIVVTLKP